MSAEEAIARWWGRLRADPAVRELVAMVPEDRELGLVDALLLAPAMVALLQTPEAQCQALEAVTQAWRQVTAAPGVPEEVPSPR